MLVFALTGTLDWLTRVVPKEVIRGIQFGLGITLATLALKDYVSADAGFGYVLAILSVALLLVFRRQKKVPAPLIVIAVGVVYALVRMRLHGGEPIVGLSLPKLTVPTRTDFEQGALLLALPQIPLSLGNSVIATSQTSRDLFPERAVSVRKIGITYGVMNLIAPFFGGLPVCHGCGGMVGFYGFGARTGGAPIIYGSLYVLIGAIFAPGFLHVINVFPKPVLGVILLFEAIGLMMFLRDIALDRSALWIALIVALISACAPLGFLSALVAGTVLSIASQRGWLRLPVDYDALGNPEGESPASLHPKAS
jgi:MFS superfamily sulfate permease-like transporter